MKKFKIGDRVIAPVGIKDTIKGVVVDLEEGFNVVWIKFDDDGGIGDFYASQLTLDIL